MIALLTALASLLQISEEAPALIVLLLAVAGWTVTSLALYVMLAFLRPESCDRTQD